MIIDEINNEVLPAISLLLQKYCYSRSSIAGLVGYKLVINGKRMDVTGGTDSVGYAPIVLDAKSPVELEHDAISYFLISSELNCASIVGMHVVDLGEVSGYAYTYAFDDESREEMQAGTLRLKSNDLLTSTASKLNLNGIVENIELELLFVKRCDLCKLPVEFNNFRKYKDWLTLGKSVQPIADVSFSSSDTLDVSSISITFKDERLKSTFVTDVAEVGRLLSGLN